MREFKEPMERDGDLMLRVKDVLGACKIISEAFLESSYERQLKIGDFFKRHAGELNKLQAFLESGGRNIDPAQRAQLEKICQSLEEEYDSDDFLSG